MWKQHQCWKVQTIYGRTFAAIEAESFLPHSARFTTVCLSRERVQVVDRPWESEVHWWPMVRARMWLDEHQCDQQSKTNQAQHHVAHSGLWDLVDGVANLQTGLPTTFGQKDHYKVFFFFRLIYFKVYLLSNYLWHTGCGVHARHYYLTPLHRCLHASALSWPLLINSSSSMNHQSLRFHSLNSSTWRFTTTSHD